MKGRRLYVLNCVQSDQLDTYGYTWYITLSNNIVWCVIICIDKIFCGEDLALPYHLSIIINIFDIQVNAFIDRRHSIVFTLATVNSQWWYTMLAAGAEYFLFWASINFCLEGIFLCVLWNVKGYCFVIQGNYPVQSRNAESGSVINSCIVEPGYWQKHINGILATMALLPFCDEPSATEIVFEVWYISLKIWQHSSSNSGSTSLSTLWNV